MTEKCTNCGRTKYETAADAKTLDFLEELQSGVYTCCQISHWAHEQWLAWCEAIQEDLQRSDAATGWPASNDTHLGFVPVRLRQQQARGSETVAISAKTTL
jgi:hypothetical protein